MNMQFAAATKVGVGQCGGDRKKKLGLLWVRWKIHTHVSRFGGSLEPFEARLRLAAYNVTDHTC